MRDLLYFLNELFFRTHKQSHAVKLNKVQKGVDIFDCTLGMIRVHPIILSHPAHKRTKKTYVIVLS